MTGFDHGNPGTPIVIHTLVPHRLPHIDSIIEEKFFHLFTSMRASPKGSNGSRLPHGYG